MTPLENFVYLFRDGRGKARYVGFGNQVARATSHCSESHNPLFMDFLNAGNYSLEIAGPFDSETIGRAVETALISALKPDFNLHLGETRWRFRPLGVPMAYAERLTLPPIGREEICHGPDGQGQSVILVKISDKNFGDGRVGYNPAAPPSDAEIVERMERWWQLGRFLPEWLAEKEKSPRLLLGVHGKPGAQIIISALEINREAWHNTEREDSFVAVPLLDKTCLDAQGLRGRRIHSEAGLRFNALYSQIFALWKP